MKIIVVSDSHGNYSLLNEIYLKHFDASIFYHLGDSQLPEYMLHSYCGVKGNCDFIDLPFIFILKISKAVFLVMQIFTFGLVSQCLIKKSIN